MSVEAGVWCRSRLPRRALDPQGQSFPDDIRASLQEAAVGLVVIGPWWIEAGDDWKDRAGQRRLHDPADWVRIEGETFG